MWAQHLFSSVFVLGVESIPSRAPLWCKGVIWNLISYLGLPKGFVLNFLKGGGLGVYFEYLFF